MRHVTIKVKRDGNTHHHLSVPAWELPILEFLFDEGNVTRTGEFKDLPDREYPDPAAEYERLQKVYGKDNESNESYAAKVFGTARAGVKALAAAIAEARAEDLAARRPRKRLASRRSSIGDPLLA